MKILILGGDGLLGHILFDYLSKKYDTFVTIKKNYCNKEQVFLNVDANNFNDLDSVIKLNNPQIIINCLGIVKQRIADPDQFIKINSFIPLYLKEKYEGIIKIIQISTSCVFDGKKGNYLEYDKKTPIDCYGYSKSLGEITGENIITLRTSFLGPEIYNHVGLFDWFLYSPKEVYGYSNAYFSGVTSLELCKVIDKVIKNESFSGLYQVGNVKINKYDLLIKINNIFNLDKIIKKKDDFCIDRSLITNKFDKEFNYKSPNWDEMLIDLKNYMGEYNDI